MGSNLKLNDNVDNLKPRRLITVRHGERMDLAFGDWIKLCFDKQGRYKPQDLNHPKKLIDREPWAYSNDSPLTPIGEFQGFLFGQALSDHGVEINHVYCSPALRCLQTCHNILKGAGIQDNLAVNIEPGLFEFLGDHLHRLPSWLTPKEAAAGTGMNINLDYKPQIEAVDMLTIRTAENHSDFYARCHKVVESIISSTVTGNILIVAHAASVDSCTRLLTGKKLPEWNDFFQFVHRIPYLAHSHCQINRNGEWKMVEPLFPGITISSNNHYDYSSLWSMLPK
ncbi:protein UBASH3A homolog [Tetranychus urticae]|uniref:Uncharacterized protein n=1 Tax=Tetranychus urticae TaxID=32264 RepID=T1KFE7_TETUR|nr:protein UBASH3A homolog [Tetranychus urticae]